MNKQEKKELWFAYTRALQEFASIVDVVKSEGVQLKPQGADWIGLSPFVEEQTPSFRISPKLQVFKCFASGHGGGVFKFLMYSRGCSFNEAVYLVAKRYKFGYAKWKEKNARRHQRG